MMLPAAISNLYIILTLALIPFIADALQVDPLGRREVLLQGGAAATGLVVADPGDLQQVFQSNNSKRGINWSPPSEEYTKLRYSSSSLSEREAVVPNAKCATLPVLPSWLEGNWLCTYKFDGASFPQGRDKLSLTVAGAGLGTCAVLPNVGYNPSPFVQKFGGDGVAIVEDVAYNLPRKFEGFWPQAKVASIRVSTAANGSSSSNIGAMSPVCLVTGEGCSQEENPLLHGKYATRCRMEFQGPTRKGGLRSQQLDLSMVDHDTSAIPSDTATIAALATAAKEDNEFLMSRTFVQYNVEQELTCYYREFVSFIREPQQQQNGSITTKLKGRTRVAAFLPSSPQAVALYSYTMKYDAITSEETLMY